MTSVGITKQRIH